MRGGPWFCDPDAAADTAIDVDVDGATGSDRLGDTGSVERIGIFGGTFDPPHNGHVAAAVQVRHALGLDRVIVVVANDPWQKQSDSISPPDVRLRLARAAFAGLESIEVSDIEIRRGGATFTIDTVEAMRVGPVQLVVVIGSDAAAGLPTWHRASDLAAIVEFAVVTREGSPESTARVLPPGFSGRLVPITRLDVSSTHVRRRVLAGEPIDGLVPPPVVREIGHSRLYTGT